MLKHLAALSVLLLLPTAACTKYAPKAATPIRFYQKQVNAELASGEWLAKYAALPIATAADQSFKTAERNRLLNEFIYVIDNSYSKFESDFYGARATEDIGGDFLQIGLTGAAALTGAAGTKTVLALVATAATGGKASIDNHWFNQQSRYAIVTQMRALRDTQLAEIEKSMAQGCGAYPLENGIRDVQEYYQAGSIVAALQAIASNAGSQATAAKAALKAVRK
jgi:hypothetical protein